MNRGNIRHLIEQLTVGAGLLVDDRALDLVEASLKAQMHDLYFVALEALRNAVDDSYSAVIGYSAKPGTLSDPDARSQVMRKLQSRLPDLQAFALRRQIPEADSKSIIKGKWLFECFCAIVLHEMRQLVSTPECS